MRAREIQRIKSPYVVVGLTRDLIGDRPPSDSNFVVYYALSHVVSTLRPCQVDTWTHELYNDTHTPSQISIEHGRLYSVTRPQINVLHHFGSTEPRHDLLLVFGNEPSDDNGNGRKFEQRVGQLLEAANPAGVILTGSLPYNHPHTRDIVYHVSGGNPSPNFPSSIPLPSYDGSSSVIMELLESLASKGISSRLLLVPIPHYMHASAKYAPGVRSLVRSLEEGLSIDLKSSDLDESVERFNDGFDQFLKANYMLREQFQKIETEFDRRRDAMSITLPPDDRALFEEITVPVKPEN